MISKGKNKQKSPIFETRNKSWGFYPVGKTAFHSISMAKRYSFFLIFILLIHFSCEAQRNNFFFDLTGGGGQLYAHHPELKPIAGSVTFFNTRIGIKMLGQKNWQRVYNYPEIGIGLSHTNLTKSYLGNPTALYSFINLPLTHESKLKLNLGIHLGFAWGFNPFLEEDQRNVAIGSKCAAYASINLNTSFRISQNLELLLYAGGYHYSNGNTSKPNKGLNMLGAETGLRYRLPISPTELNTEPVTPIVKSSSIMTFGAWGWKKEATHSFQIYVGSISTGYYRTVSNKSRLSAGIDLFDDEGALYFSMKENTLRNILAVGVFGGHELTFNQFSIVTQVGIYLRNPNPVDPFYYERLGIRYMIAKRIIPSISIKAHQMKVDFIEWGLGFVLWRS